MPDLGANTRDLPVGVLEALAAAWADLLVADYQARHATPEVSPLQRAPRRPAPAYDALSALNRTCH